MNSNRNLYLTFLITWIVSTAVAYWVGLGRGRAAAESEAGGGTAAAPGPAGGAGGVARARGGGGQPGAAFALEGGDPGADRLPVKTLLLQVQQKLQGGFMNQRGFIDAWNLVQQLRAEDIPEAIEFAESIQNPQQKQMVLMSLLGRWAEFDGAAAAAYADGLKGPFKMGAVHSVIASWAADDPEAVLTWYEEKKASGEFKGGGPFSAGGPFYLMSVYASLGSRDFDGTFDRVLKLEDGQERQMALQGLVQSAMGDAEQRARLMGRLDELPDDEAKAQATALALSQWAQFEPSGAAAYVEGLPEGKTRTQAVQQVGSAWMMTDPKVGADWIFAQAGEDDKPRVVNNVIGQWVYQDYEAAATWLDQFEAGPGIDQAVSTLAGGAAHRDGQFAMQWAETISDEDMRRNTIMNVFTQWRGRDAAAAEAYLENVTLPAEAKKELLEQPVPETPAVGGAIHYGF